MKGGRGIEKLCDFLSALGDGTRLKILSALAIKDMCVNDLSIGLGLNQTTVSHQLKNLRSVGLVKYRRQGKINFYSLRDKRVVTLLNLVTDLVG
jgi:DNA-binding transcriptional ArsR family regulator